MIVLGVITGAHGVHGRVKIKSYTEDPRDLVSYGSLSFEDGGTAEVKITGQGKDHLLCEIEGVKGREKAQALKGKTLSVPRNAMPETEDHDGFYVEDLIGLNVIDANEQSCGTVSKVFNHGAGDIVEITFADTSKKELFLFTDAAFPQISLENDTITFIRPETLIAKET